MTGWNLSALLFWDLRVWIFPLFSLIFLSLVTVQLSPWKGHRRIAAAWLWEITLPGRFWKNTVCWLTGSDINIQDWIDSLQDISLLGIANLRHDFFPSFVLPLWRHGERSATSFFLSPRYAKLHWVARSRYCFALGFQQTNLELVSEYGIDGFLDPTQCAESQGGSCFS